MKLSNGIRKALLVSMAALLAGSLVFTGCKGSDDGSDPIRQMILLQQIENAKTLQQKINESGAVLDLGGAVKANDAVISKAMTLKNVNLGGKTLTVKASGVVLEGVKSAKIVVSKDIADGEFTMKNCEGIEKVTVNGGGSNSVHIEGSVVQSLAVAKAGVRIALEGKSRIESAAVKADGIKLVGNAESTVAKVALASGVRSLALAGGTIEKIVSKTAVKLQIQENGTKINQVKSSAAVQFEKADDVNDFVEVAIEALDDEDWDDADFEGWGDEDFEDEDDLYDETGRLKTAIKLTLQKKTGAETMEAAESVLMNWEHVSAFVSQDDLSVVKVNDVIYFDAVCEEGQQFRVHNWDWADVATEIYNAKTNEIVAPTVVDDQNSFSVSGTFYFVATADTIEKFAKALEFHGDATISNVAYATLPTVISVESVAINAPVMLWDDDEPVDLTVAVEPENATSKKITWESDNTDVATVSKSGKLTPKSAGTAKITATVGGVSETTTVTVAKLAINTVSHTIAVNDTVNLAEAVSVYPTDSEITWASSDTEIATVENGTVTGKAEGTAKITATVLGRTVECSVTVSSNIVAVTGVKFAVESVTIPVGTEKEYPVATVSPENATNSTPTYTTDDETVAKVQDGKIVALKVGKTTLKATAENFTDTIEINVVHNVDLTDGTIFGSFSNWDGAEDKGAGKFVANDDGTYYATIIIKAGINENGDVGSKIANLDWSEKYGKAVVEVDGDPVQGDIAIGDEDGLMIHGAAINDILVVTVTPELMISVKKTGTYTPEDPTGGDDLELTPSDNLLADPVDLGTDWGMPASLKFSSMSGSNDAKKIEVTYEAQSPVADYAVLKISTWKQNVDPEKPEEYKETYVTGTPSSTRADDGGYGLDQANGGTFTLVLDDDGVNTCKYGDVQFYGYGVKITSIKYYF